MGLADQEFRARHESPCGVRQPIEAVFANADNVDLRVSSQDVVPSYYEQGWKQC